MIVFRKGSPWYLIFSCVGSVFPQAMLHGLISGIFSLIIDKAIPFEGYLKDMLDHPYPFQPFIYIASFVLVFRTNVAYNRYWEMASDVTLMGAKWGDAFAEAVTFDELPRGKTLEERSKKLAIRRRFQALMIRRYSLMHALALQYLRRDDHLDNLFKVGPQNPTTVPMGLGTFGGMRGASSRKDEKWQLLEVLGGLSDYERQCLTSAHDRVGWIFSNIMHLSNQRRADGGLGVDAPVLSRYYQLMSDGSLGFRQARKIEDINFPWPYTQAVSIFLYVFMFLFPLLLSTFANDGENRYIWMAPLITFVTVTSFTVLHKVARALEDPFVHPPNDLAANALQAAFNCRLLTTWDALRRPEDALEFSEPVGVEGSYEGIDKAFTPKFSQDEGINDEESLWEEYAYLEPEEVKKVTYDFLKEWRAAGSGGRSKFFTDKVATPKLVRNSQPSMRRIPSYTASSPRPASFETNKNGKAKLQVEMMPTTPSPGGAKGFKPMKEEVVSVVPDGAVA